MVLSEALPSIENLFAVRTSPSEPLLVKLLLVRFPVGLGLERFFAKGTSEVFGWRDARRLRETRRCGQTGAVAVAAKGSIGGRD